MKNILLLTSLFAVALLPVTTTFAERNNANGYQEVVLKIKKKYEPFDALSLQVLQKDYLEDKVIARLGGVFEETKTVKIAKGSTIKIKASDWLTEHWIIPGLDINRDTGIVCYTEYEAKHEWDWRAQIKCKICSGPEPNC